MKTSTHTNTKATFPFRWRSPLLPKHTRSCQLPCFLRRHKLTRTKRTEKENQNQLRKGERRWWTVMTGQANPTPRPQLSPSTKAFGRWDQQPRCGKVCEATRHCLPGSGGSWLGYQQRLGAGVLALNTGCERTLIILPAPQLWSAHQNPREPTGRITPSEAGNQKSLLFSLANLTQRKSDPKGVTQGVLQQNNSQQVFNARSALPLKCFSAPILIIRHRSLTKHV